MLLTHTQGGFQARFEGGDPAPSDVHKLYEEGYVVTAEAYPGQLGDMYHANGRRAVVDFGEVSVEEANKLLGGLKCLDAVMGPVIREGVLMPGSLALWLVCHRA